MKVYLDPSAAGYDDKLAQRWILLYFREWLRLPIRDKGIADEWFKEIYGITIYRHPTTEVIVSMTVNEEAETILLLRHFSN